MWIYPSQREGDNIFGVNLITSAGRRRRRNVRCNKVDYHKANRTALSY